MLTKQDIQQFCSQYTYDIRQSGNGRWIDQKCAADVVCIIADCIERYVEDNKIDSFTTKAIWQNTYTVNNVEKIFSKPGVESVAAKNEYDKFFQQPMEMLANANVLKKIKLKNRNYYKINNKEVLDYIAFRERNALIFLIVYIEKVLRDSDLYNEFEKFFENPTSITYRAVKRAFSDFTIRYTKIRTVVECNRIFIKVLNPLAFDRKSYGTEKGHMSRDKITYDKLMYNRDNFRDLYAEKPKGMTRKEYAKQHPMNVNRTLYNYQSQKAKNLLREFNNKYRQGRTENYQESQMNDIATQMHHIFPEAEYPEICAYLENIIALTPTQHFNYAHPNGNTGEINDMYQQQCLLSKTKMIYDNLTDVTIEKIYEFSNFLYVLRVGFDNDNILKIANMDFDAVYIAINVYYALRSF